MNSATAPELILASASPYRRALLERLGIAFRAVAPEFDERAISSEGLSPRSLAELLAAGKARSVQRREPRAIVIGCDQLVSLDGRILGKPGTVERAVAQLEAMSGRVHELITAMVLAGPDGEFAHTDVSRLRMRRLDHSQIERYVAADVPLDCAGSYKLEKRGVVLFDRIDTEDATAITGLPLLALIRLLERFGCVLP